MGRLTRLSDNERDAFADETNPIDRHHRPVWHDRPGYHPVGLDVAIWRAGTASPSRRDRQFESPFLQRRVSDASLSAELFATRQVGLRSLWRRDRRAAAHWAGLGSAVGHGPSSPSRETMVGNGVRSPRLGPGGPATAALGWGAPHVLCSSGAGSAGGM
jgi:hypothetical protein